MPRPRRRATLSSSLALGSEAAVLAAAVVAAAAAAAWVAGALTAGVGAGACGDVVVFAAGGVDPGTDVRAGGGRFTGSGGGAMLTGLCELRESIRSSARSSS